MKTIFASLFALCLLLYVVAVSTLDSGVKPGVVHLRWATDPNPARTVQTKLFGEKYPGYEITVESGAMEKLLVQCATGTGPDIIDVYDVQQLSGYVEAGLLLDLTDYAKKMGFDPSHTYPALHDDLLVEGRQYRVPCNVWANCVVFNKKIFDDHGVPYPKDGWTYAEYLAALQKFNTPGASGSKHIPVANYSSSWYFCDLYFRLGGQFFSRTGLRSRLDSPEALKAMQLYHDEIYVQKIVPSPEVAASISAQGGWGSGGITWFSNERAAVIVIGRWYTNILGNYPELATHLGTVRQPLMPGYSSTIMCGSRAAGINAKSPQRDAALKFLQYLSGPDYNRLIVRDGDSLPPNPELARSGAALVTRTAPDPAFHQPFVDAMTNARPVDNSPFIDAQLVARWLMERLGRVENNEVLDVDEVMRDFAKEINLRIRLNLEREKHLQKKFEEVTGKAYRADWQE